MLDQLQPILVMVIVILLLNMAYLTILRNKLSVGLFIILNSAFVMITALMILYNTGILADELGLSGDSTSFWLTILVCILAGASMLIALRYFNKKNE